MDDVAAARVDEVDAAARLHSARLELAVEIEAREGLVVARQRQADDRDVAKERQPPQISGAEGDRPEAAVFDIAELPSPAVVQPKPPLVPARRVAGTGCATPAAMAAREMALCGIGRFTDM